MLGTLVRDGHAARRARSNLQFIGIGGVDYFQQDNNLVSPPELQFEPQRRAARHGGAEQVVATATSTWPSTPPTRICPGPRHGVPVDHVGRRAVRGAAAVSPPRSSGATLLTGQEKPAAGRQPDRELSTIEPVRDLGLFGQEEVLLANRRLLLTAGLRADRSSANGNPGKYLLLSQGGRLVPVHQAVRAAGRAQVPRRVRADRQPGRLRRPVLVRHDRHDRWAASGRSSGTRAGRSRTSSRSGRRSSRPGSTRPSAAAGRSSR